ncbi:hypothetical protein DPX39_040043300 [Trypanosoma brucei equiperdum]|uniref:WD domain n=1 Tax=Trypanosoma brucei equiperdum TaxID=630700 RepID=A0A3L6L7Y8_9TRYP|nr:hypothetical protein DPX39_040043300 [Trypanosoma brucei equiperdum]
MQSGSEKRNGQKRPRHAGEAAASSPAVALKQKKLKPKKKTDNAGEGNEDQLQKRRRKQEEKRNLPIASSSPTAAQQVKSPVLDQVQAKVPTEECRSALLVIGTYHSVMAGLLYRRRRFGLLFSIKHHVGCINAVTAGGGAKYMASAGTDERVFLFTNKSHSVQKQLKLLKKKQKRQAKRLKKGGEPCENGVEMEETLAFAGPSAETNSGSSAEPLALRLTDLGHVSPPSEVRCMKITSNSQLMLCGCTDGQLITYRTRDWSINSAIPLHEKCISSIALHPGSNNDGGSGAALAITCSAEDHHIVVVDLLRGRLLSKWRYSTSLATAISRYSANKDNGGRDNVASPAAAQTTSDSDEPGRPVKLAKWERHDEPREVHFSPVGSYFAVLSSHALLVYETATMRAVAHYRAPSPLQPHNEMHTFCFMDEQTIMIGDESGNIRCCCGPWQGACVPGIVERRIPHGSEGGNVGVCGTNNSSGDTTGSFAAGSDASQHSGRHPTKHSTRVKALHCAGRTLFSLDAAGVAIAWNVDKRGASSNNSISASGKSSDLMLHYICSANCRGRVTTMDVLRL